MIAPFEVAIPKDATAPELAYLSALQRIMDGKPSNEILRTRISNGRFRPSRLTVADEAGRSRTPLSSGDFPRVLLEINRAQRHHQASVRPMGSVAKLDEEAERRLVRRQNGDLRERNSILTQERNAAYTSSAACVILARALEKAGRRHDLDIQAARREAEQTALLQ